MSANEKTNPIRDALDLLDGGKHWIQKCYDDGNENYCMKGAINKAIGYTDMIVTKNTTGRVDEDSLLKLAQEASIYYAVISEVIKGQYPDIDSTDVAMFNDYHAEWEDVERVMEKAAIKLDEKI